VSELAEAAMIPQLAPLQAEGDAVCLFERTGALISQALQREEDQPLKKESLVALERFFDQTFTGEEGGDEVDRLRTFCVDLLGGLIRQDPTRLELMDPAP
jgi:hypothetical protein